MSKTLKIGHRGAKGHLAENTLESIDKALQLNVDGIEIDVHVCKSGELVVFHDFTLDRMTNATGEIGKYTLTELKQFKVNGNYQIPTLVEVLNLIDNKCLLNIELKGEYTAKPVVDLLSKYYDKNIKNIVLSSFLKEELTQVSKLNPSIALGVLTKASVNQALKFAKTINAKSIHPNFALLSQSNVVKVQEEGFKVYTWTVNDQDSINRMKTYGVDAIISDYPDRI